MPLRLGNGRPEAWLMVRLLCLADVQLAEPALVLAQHIFEQLLQPLCGIGAQNDPVRHLCGEL